VKVNGVKKPIMFGLVTMMVGYLCLTVVAQALASDLLAAAQAAAQRYPNAKAVYLTNDETMRASMRCSSSMNQSACG